MEKSRPSFWNHLLSRPVIAIGVAIGLIITSAGLGLIIPNTFAPLLVAGGVAGSLVFILWLKKPITAFYTAVWLVFLPLGLIPTEIHSFLNRFTVVAAFITWGIMTIFSRQRVVLTPAAISMSVFLVWGLTTLAWSSVPSVTFYNLQIYALRWILFLILGANFLNERNHQKSFMRVLTLNGWILIALFLFTLVTSGYNPGTRLKIAGMNENETATLAIILLPAILWGNSSQPNKGFYSKHAAPVVYILLTCLLTVMSGSRGGLLSLVVVMLGFSFLRETRLYPLFGIGCTLLIILVYPQLFATFFYRLTVESSQSLLGGREAIWKAAMMMIADHTWFGIGLGNAPTEILSYLRFFTPVSSNYVALHNPLLTLWAETGVIGLLLYGSVFISSAFVFLSRFYHALKLRLSSAITRYSINGIAVAAYLVSWIKGGGAESTYTFFLALLLLNLPILSTGYSDTQPTG